MKSKKIVLTGCFGVGKTSLFNRFLYNRFSEQSQATIGVKVDKKVLELGGRQISMLVWDIAGDMAQEKVPQSYFLGSSAIIYVFDITRPETWANLGQDVQFLEGLVQGTLIRTVGNKLDLATPTEQDSLLRQAPGTLLASAKTGENVALLFQEIGTSLLGQ